MSRHAKRLPPWEENPFRLVSLWEIMKAIQGHETARCSGMLRMLAAQSDERGYVRPDSKGLLKDCCGEVLEVCDALDLPITAGRLRNLIFMLRAIKDDAVQAIEIRHHLEQVEVVFREELQTKLFFFIPTSRAQLYDDPIPFGEGVSTSFPAAKYDIAEAGKCFACGRWTAAVFHVSRALEVALGALANATGVQPDKNWNLLIDQIEKQIRTGLVAPSPKPHDWKSVEQFYSEAAAHFRNIKNGWRNPVSHPGVAYDEESAKAIFDSSRAFMRHLATKLSA